MAYYLYKNISELITLVPAFKKNGKKLLPQDLGSVKNYAVVFDHKSIVWVGENQHVPSSFLENSKIFDLTGYVVTPEIVDSHTHLVFAGDRSEEYLDRLNGVDYQAIAAKGGGILYTSEQTNQISEEQLFELSSQKIQHFLDHGIGTIEIKSGYGLARIHEEKILRVIQNLKQTFYPRAQIFATYLGAHAVPKIYSSSNEYISKEVLPSLEDFAKKNLIDFVDVFHEKNYFDDHDVEMIFTLSLKLKLKLKIHADEFNDNGGIELAKKFSCVSADHLLCSNPKYFSGVAQSNLVATLLPGTGLFLGKKQALAKKMLDEGICVSIASDFNPGSCHFPNVLQIATMMAPTLQMNIAQFWSAITLNAAKALGITDQGAIAQGLAPRFSVFKCEKASLINYCWGENLAVIPPHLY